MDDSKKFQLMLDQAISIEPQGFKDFDKTKNVQDQLQEMAKHKDTGLLLGKFFWWATRSPTGHTLDVQKTHACDSMEQLWLSFLMAEKFKKQWDEEKGEWDAPNR